jgi:hypothetical protein
VYVGVKSVAAEQSQPIQVKQAQPNASLNMRLSVKLEQPVVVVVVVVVVVGGDVAEPALRRCGELATRRRCSLNSAILRR